jgi:hypothetical protein
MAVAEVGALAVAAPTAVVVAEVRIAKFLAA